MKMLSLLDYIAQKSSVDVDAKYILSFIILIGTSWVSHGQVVERFLDNSEPETLSGGFWSSAAAEEWLCNAWYDVDGEILGELCLEEAIWEEEGQVEALLLSQPWAEHMEPTLGTTYEITDNNKLIGKLTILDLIANTQPPQQKTHPFPVSHETSQTRNQKQETKSKKAEAFEIDVFEPIPIDANPDTLSLKNAAKNGHPERLTASLQPRPFDRIKFEQDPYSYLHTIEPGRVFMTASPAEGVPPIQVKGPTHQTVSRGGSVPLKVQAAPKSPVTFTSFDAGAFDNKLASITVLTDEKGEASVHFYGIAGVIGDCHILAGCPEAYGQASFVVIVNPVPKDEI